MARKTLGTRQKMVFRLPPNRPGNPFAVTEKASQSGLHGKKALPLPRIARVPMADVPHEEEGSQ